MHLVCVRESHLRSTVSSLHLLNCMQGNHIQRANIRGTLIVLSGPSGVGKTTIHNKILEHRPDLCISVSATSRPMRPGEVDGREYIFLTEDEFKEWIDDGRFIEYARVHGNWYGTPRQALVDNLNRGCHVLTDVDVQGAKRLMKLFPDGLYCFIVPPEFEELEKRLKKRNTDKRDEIKHRLERAKEELEYKKDYTHIIENKTVDEAVEHILKIIEKEIGKRESSH